MEIRIQDMPPVTWVDDPESMMSLVKHVRDTKECAQDTETTGLNRHSDHVLFWSLCPDEQSRYCLSREMLEIFDQELSQDPSISWYYTNQPFDFCMLHNSGVRPPVGPSYCTLSMDWLLDENRIGRHGLKETAGEYLGLYMSDFKEVFKGRKRTETLQDRLLRAMDEEFEKATSYAATDAWATFRVFKYLRRRLEQEVNFFGDSLWSHFVNVEMPFTRVLYNCCRRGIMVDVGYLGELGPKIEADMLRIRRQINKVAGKEINLNSTPQMRDFIFNTLKLKPVRHTKGGSSGVQHPSTDAYCLEKWASEGVEPIEWIVEYRDLAKKYGTYVQGMLKWVDRDFRIHPTMTQHVTVTGRLSSVDPNLQNIPRPGTDKFGIRSAFIPKEHHVLIVSDYEQLEMRLLAHLSEDANMIEVINKGWDIHTGTASLMFNYPYDDIISAIARGKAAKKDKSIKLTELEQAMIFSRQASKTIGFGLNYGEGIDKLAKTLGVSREKAAELKETYFKPYPNVKAYIEGTHNCIREEYRVPTIMGRWRRFPEMQTIGNTPYWQLRGNQKATLAQCERQSVNAEVQGSAADVAKMAMILCDQDPELQRLGCELLLQVHDELVFECPEETAREALPIVRHLMEHSLGYDLSVPLGVDIGIGLAWSEAKA